MPTTPIETQIDALDERVHPLFEPPIPLALGFAWTPISKSPIVVEKVTVDGNSIDTLKGAVDSESPLVLPIGSYPAGTKVKVTWTVRALNDIRGIQASVRAQTAKKWSTAKAKSPLAYQAAYSGSKTYTIPSPPASDENPPA